MNIYHIVLNEREVEKGMMDVVNGLNSVQQSIAMTIFSNSVVKVGDVFHKFIIKDDYLISRLHGLDVEEIIVGDGVVLNYQDINFLRSKTNRICGLISACQ